MNGQEPPVPPRGAAAPAIGPGSTPAPGPRSPAAAGRAGSLLAVHAAVFLFGISGLLGKMVDTPPLVIGAGQNAAAALVLAPWIALAPPSLSVRDLAILLALGVFCTALAHVLFIRGLSRVRARTASVIAALEPVYGILLALAILREAPAPRTIAGGAIVVACAMLAGLRDPGDGGGPRQSL